MAENLSNPIQRSGAWDGPAVGPVTEHATIGSSIVIKGEVSGTEALFIDGTVEGSIHIPDHRVTVGRRSTVKANIKARDVVVMGTVKGNIQCGDLLDVRAESNIQGEIATRRSALTMASFLREAWKFNGWKKPRKSRKPRSLSRRSQNRRGPGW